MRTVDITSDCKRNGARERKLLKFTTQQDRITSVEIVHCYEGDPTKRSSVSYPITDLETGIPPYTESFATFNRFAERFGISSARLTELVREHAQNIPS